MSDTSAAACCVLSCSLNLPSLSLAIPAIGTGIYRLPPGQAIESIVHTVLLYLQENRPATKIDRIVFFDHDSSKAQTFANCLIATSCMITTPQRATEALQASLRYPSLTCNLPRELTGGHWLLLAGGLPMEVPRR